MPESPVAEQRSFVELVPLDETSRGKGSRGRDQLQVHGQVRLELERGRTTSLHSRVVHGHVEHQHDACGTRFLFGLLRPGRREPSRPQSLEMCRVVVFAGLVDEYVVAPVPVEEMLGAESVNCPVGGDISCQA
jgi:hypothetical protein